MKGKIKIFQKCVAFRPSVLGMRTRSSEGVLFRCLEFDVPILFGSFGINANKYLILAQEQVSILFYKCTWAFVQIYTFISYKLLTILAVSTVNAT